MATEDPTVTDLKRALAMRLEIDFKLGGAPVTMRPHMLYGTKSGDLRLAGQVGSVPGALRVFVSQIKDLIVSPRHFQPDTTFDLADPDYDYPVARAKGI